jgi:phosphoribosylglycinamide formyltransferase-1
MYGDNVHKQVLSNKEKETGITIHFVNEKYDKGEIIFQKKINLQNDETLNSIKAKIKSLEMKHFPIIIYQLLYGRKY